MSADYRQSHIQEGQVAWYENRVYAPDSRDSWVWKQEQGVVSEILDRHFGDRPIRLLDFASGTGRILSFLEPRVAEATGVDISENMLSVAAQKVPKAKLVCADITRDHSAVSGPFDLITAFRFFQRAQESLRDEVMATLAPLLAPDGVLVFNIHGNLWSPRLPSYLARRYVLRQQISQISINHARDLLTRHGLRLVEYHGIGLFTPRMYKLFGVKAADRVEHQMRQRPWLQRFAVDVLLVATRQ